MSVAGNDLRLKPGTLRSSLLLGLLVHMPGSDDSSVGANTVVVLVVYLFKGSSEGLHPFICMFGKFLGLVSMV